MTETPDQHSDFQQAYLRLQRLTEPVTAETLKATSRTYGGEGARRLWGIFPRHSSAENWSLKMWITTGFTIAFILVTELLNNIVPVWHPVDPGDTAGGFDLAHFGLEFLTLLLPFAYGLFGSCAYLLRACHKRIGNRTFDLHRIAEYKNRMILGLVSGGGVNLFISEILVENGSGATQLSASAVAFLAGYNTEYLFQLIERLSQALLPRKSD
jgi:hypothetical protein